MRKTPILILLTVGSILSMQAYSSECDDWQTNHPEWLWCDDFEESSTLNSRYEDVSTNGMSQSTNDAHEGDSSLEQTYTPGQVDAGWVTKVNDSGFPDRVFYRYYHKFGPGFSTYPPKTARIGYRDRSNWQEILRVHTWLTENGELTLDTRAVDSSQTSNNWLARQFSGISFSQHSGQWLAIEVEVQLNSIGNTDGHFRMWVDDALVIETLNLDLRGSETYKINEIMLDTYWNGGATGSLSRYYDNFVISTEKIGLLEGEVPDPPDDEPQACNISEYRNVIIEL